jgi:hypothetical protein
VKLDHKSESTVSTQAVFRIFRDTTSILHPRYTLYFDDVGELECPSHAAPNQTELAGLQEGTAGP